MRRPAAAPPPAVGPGCPGWNGLVISAYSPLALLLHKPSFHVPDPRTILGNPQTTGLRAYHQASRPGKGAGSAVMG
ncbi:hypothetical protein SRL2020226_38090 [Mycobacterium kiyosense]|nr:hypothetical protein IWGMT90018_48260 [Mycobacterium kiyosense]GLB97033.1 hypothetical protein SRL2020226_38090 [Mycobacterium kiyosense]GLD21659.1 hypothetical protein Mkiyose1385_57580 [Mycobacterium kiyosense]GLD39095.1 hypothetical protein Mkiyose1595_53150 [Mycobacterium kiyosense]